MGRALLLLLLLLGQDTVKVGVNLVTVGVRVTDSKGAEVRGLNTRDFTILDDGVPQKIALFSPGTEQAVMLGILLDRSFSMSYNSKLDRAKESALELVRGAHSGSQFFYLPFDDHLPTETAVTADRTQVESEIERTNLGAGTSLYDAVLEGIRIHNRTNLPRQVLVVISDGADEQSKHHRDEVVQAVRDAQIQVFTIGYFTPAEEKLYRTPKTSVRLPDNRVVENPRSILEGLARESGAESFFPTSDAELVKAVNTVNVDLQAQYTLGFYAGTSNAPAHYHELRVKVTGRYNVRTRTGYRGP